MIVSCDNCYKKFDIDSNLIPEKGRLVQCNNCNHKWFFKTDIIKEPAASIQIDKPTKGLLPFNEEQKNKKIDKSENIELLDKKIEEKYLSDMNYIKNKEDKILEVDLKNENIKNYNILGLITVFIISFIALIIILDTFQNPISKMIPSIEFILYSLYETINDIKLFIKDLI